MSDKFNVYQAVTDRIIKQLEQGVVPWHKPWSGVSGGAYNRVSGKTYSLLNQLLLEHEGEYATFKQWNEMGGKVKKGAKSEIVVFWKMIKVDDDKKQREGDKDAKITIPMLRYYRVFHISQVEGVEPNSIEAVEHEPITEAEAIKMNYIDREGIEILEEVSNEAYYAPLADRIVVPCMEQYEDVLEFYSTLFHEMVHSTGHKNRLARLDPTKTTLFASDGYSKEELVAEIGSSFLMNHIGIESDRTFNNSTAYIKSWINALKGDNRFIVGAAGKAEKAVKYILDGNAA